MKPLYLSLLVALVLLAGCVSTNVTPLDGGSYPPVDPASVRIYVDEADIEGAYTKLALIYAKGDYTFVSERKLLKKAQARAAELGANGLLVRGIDVPLTGSHISNGVVDTSADLRGELIAIYVHSRPYGYSERR